MSIRQAVGRSRERRRAIRSEDDQAASALGRFPRKQTVAFLRDILPAPVEESDRQSLWTQCSREARRSPWRRTRRLSELDSEWPCGRYGALTTAIADAAGS